MNPLRTTAAALVAAGFLAMSTPKASAVTLQALYSFGTAPGQGKIFSYDNATGNFSASGLVTFGAQGGGLPSGTFLVDFNGTSVGNVVADNQEVSVSQFTFTDVSTGDVLTVNTTGDIFLAGASSQVNINVQDNGTLFSNLISFTSTLNGGQNLNLNPAGYPGVTARDYSMTLTGVSTNTLSVGLNGRWNSYTALFAGNGDYSAAVVPEPSSMALLVGVSIAGTLFRRRSRKA